MEPQKNSFATILVARGNDTPPSGEFIKFSNNFRFDIHRFKTDVISRGTFNAVFFFNVGRSRASAEETLSKDASGREAFWCASIVSQWRT